MSAPQKPSEVLRAARKLIEKPEAWTRKYFARGKSGRPVLSTSKRAVCWCAIGALDRSYNDVAARVRSLHYLSYLKNSDDNLVSWNDNPDTTHADVLSTFDRAIAAAEAAGE